MVLINGQTHDPTEQYSVYPRQCVIAMVILILGQKVSS